MDQNPTQIPSQEDAITRNKTIYDVGGFEIFWRNFLAGSSRALGGLILYLLFIGIIGSLAAQFILPKMTPLFESLNQATGTLKNVQNMQNNLENLQNIKLPSQFSLP